MNIKRSDIFVKFSDTLTGRWLFTQELTSSTAQMISRASNLSPAAVRKQLTANKAVVTKTITFTKDVR